MKIAVALLVLSVGCDHVFGIGDPYEDARGAPPADIAPGDSPDDTMADAQLVLPEPMLHYRFDGSLDEASGAAAATCTTSAGGTCAFTTGVYGQAVQLDGSSVGEIVLPQLPPSFTVMAWVRPMQGPVFVLPRTLAEPTTYVWSLEIATSIDFLTNNGLYKTTTGVPMEPWTNLAVTYGGGEQRLYVDHVLVGITSVAAIGYGTNHVMYFGVKMPNTPITYYTGAIDDVYVFSSVLTQPQIAALASTPL